MQGRPAGLRRRLWHEAASQTGAPMAMSVEQASGMGMWERHRSFGMGRPRPAAGAAPGLLMIQGGQQGQSAAGRLSSTASAAGVLADAGRPSRQGRNAVVLREGCESRAGVCMAQVLSHLMSQRRFHAARQAVDLHSAFALRVRCGFGATPQFAQLHLLSGLLHCIHGSMCCGICSCALPDIVLDLGLSVSLDDRVVSIGAHGICKRLLFQVACTDNQYGIIEASLLVAPKLTAPSNGGGSGSQDRPCGPFVSRECKYATKSKM